MLGTAGLGAGGFLAANIMLGAATDLVDQLLKIARGKQCGINWKQVGVAGLLGAVAGPVLSFVGKGLGLALRGVGRLASKAIGAAKSLADDFLSAAKAAWHLYGPGVNPKNYEWTEWLADWGKKAASQTNMGVPLPNGLPRYIGPGGAAKGGRSQFFDDIPTQWQATRPKGSGQLYDVYRRKDIDWDRLRQGGDKNGIGLTNKEAASRFGLSPELNDGNFATLHHLGQDARGGLVEASTRYHGVGKYGQDILHSQYGRSQPHPIHPPNRKQFDVDTREYWKWRSNN